MQSSDTTWSRVWRSLSIYNSDGRKLWIGVVGAIGAYIGYRFLP